MAINEGERLWDRLFRALGEVKGEVRRVLSDPRNDAPLVLQHACNRADALIREFWAKHRPELLLLDDGLLDEIIDLVRVRYQTYRASLSGIKGDGGCAEDAEIASIMEDLTHLNVDLEAIKERLLATRGVVEAARRWEVVWDAYLDKANEALFNKEST